MGLHHTDDPVCPLCEQKLGSAHPFMQDWYRELKKRYINVHIAWSFRGEEDQNQAFADGKSKCRWPNSPHNHHENKLPCSLALDIFQIDDDGVGRWSPMFYAKVNAENERDRVPVLWGGKWKFADTDHFEYRAPTTTPLAA